MKAPAETGPSMAGMVLVATPALLDPNFRKTILLLSHHTREEGAAGIVINRPLGMTFGEIAKLNDEGILGRVPLFYGGPVGAHQPMLFGLRWDETSGLEFRNFSASDPLAFDENWQDALRVVIGHSGWSPGQLESEIERKSWFVLQPHRDLIEMPSPQEAWRLLLRRMDPMLKLLAEAPEDPSLN